MQARLLQTAMQEKIVSSQKPASECSLDLNEEEGRKLRFILSGTYPNVEECSRIKDSKN